MRMAAVGSMPANGLKGETITRLSMDIMSKLLQTAPYMASCNPLLLLLTTPGLATNWELTLTSHESLAQTWIMSTQKLPEIFLFHNFTDSQTWELP